jgi:transcriptional regulator with GAF, ATPase, and Fis domain
LESLSLEVSNEKVTKALRMTDGNRAGAARLLGLEAKYLLRLMKSLQIE